MSSHTHTHTKLAHSLSRNTYMVAT